MSGENAASIEASDPLAEADFHMAYGLYDQAADPVQLAAKREPQRRDLKLKLLEIYFVWGNRDRFLEVARDLGASRAQAQAGEWDKILMRASRWPRMICCSRVRSTGLATKASTWSCSVPTPRSTWQTWSVAKARRPIST